MSAIVWLVRLEGRVDANKAAIGEAEQDIADRASSSEVQSLRMLVNALEAKVALVHEQFHEYQLAVAKEYTTREAVSEIKGEIIAEMGKMEQRMELQITRLVRAPEATARRNREAE